MDHWSNRKIDRRAFLKIVGVAGGMVSIGLPLSGCSPAAQKSVFEANTGGISLVGGLPHTTWYIGEAKGFYAEEGIKNVLTEFQGGSDAVRGLTEGGFHYVSTAVSPAVVAFSQGAAIKVVAGWWQPATSIAFAVKPDSPYKTLQDLKGKKIGFSRPASLTHFFILKAIKAAGLSDKEFNLVPVGGLAESKTALVGGVVDASWSGDYQMALGVLDKSLRPLFWAHELVKDWQELVIAASSNFIKSNADTLKRFLRASQKTLEWTGKNLDEAAKVWADAAKIDPNVALQLLKVVPKDAFTLKLSAAGLKVNEENMQEFKLIDKPVLWKELVDQSLLPSELRIDLPS